MKTIVKQTSLAFTQGELDQIDDLRKEFGENYSQVLKRALILLHYITFNDKKEEK